MLRGGQKREAIVEGNQMTKIDLVLFEDGKYKNPFIVEPWEMEFYVLREWPSGSVSLAAGPFTDGRKALESSLVLFEKQVRFELERDSAWLDKLRGKDLGGIDLDYPRPEDVLIKLLR